MESRSKVGIDTNVLVRFVTATPREDFLGVVKWYNFCKANNITVYVSDWAIAEAIYVLKHHYDYDLEKAHYAIYRFLLGAQGLDLEYAQMSLEVLKEMLNPYVKEPCFYDRLLCIDYLKRLGFDYFATMDKKAKKLPNTHIIKRETD